MTRFNSIPLSDRERLGQDPHATTNYAGGLAFRLSPKHELYQRVLTCLCGEPKFYTTGAQDMDAIERVAAQVAEIDPEWLLKLAVYARQVMHLRSISVLLLVLAAELPNCKQFVRKWTPSILRRADEPAEVIAAWIARHGSIGGSGQSGGKHAFPNCLKKGIADALEHFDEYQLQKYNRSHAVKLRDVLSICHPRPKNQERETLYKYLRRGWDRLTEEEQGRLPKIQALHELQRLPDFGPEAIRLASVANATWEVMLAKFGNKAQVWDAIELPFMAGLRNLRNLVQSGSVVTLEKVLDQLQDAEAIRRSKQFPFRFLAAYRQLLDEAEYANTSSVLAALSRAIDLSLGNLPTLDGFSVAAADNSGSMDTTLSARGSVTYADVANLFTAMIQRLSKSGLPMAFGTSAVPVACNPVDSVLTNAQMISDADTRGMATNGYKVIAYLRGVRDAAMTQLPIIADRILLFTDCEMYDSGGYGGSVAEEIEKYRRTVNPNTFLYVFNLAGSGTTQVRPGDSRSVQISGWSEQVLRFIPLFENGTEIGIAEVDNMQPRLVKSETDQE